MAAIVVDVDTWQTRAAAAATTVRLYTLPLGTHEVRVASEGPAALEVAWTGEDGAVASDASYELIPGGGSAVYVVPRGMYTGVTPSLYIRPQSATSTGISLVCAAR